jgi:predicted TIM-barrel fold metal-dependent hydrolase
VVQLAHPGVSPDVSPELIAKIPPIVDVDAHLVEPPDIWTPRLPEKFREAGPHVEYHPAGSIVLQGAGYIEAPGTEGPDVVWWNYEGTMTSLKRHIAASGFKPEEITLTATTYDEIRPGCYRVPDRLADMDINGVEAQLCFPNYPRFAGQIFLWGKDKELAELCIYAYNDWMVDEWCGSSGGRLLPLCIVPLWDAELAAAEIRRNAARGVRAVAFTEIPAYLGLPSIHTGYWDPFFRACEETSTIICLHIGSGTKTLQTSSDAPDAVPASLIFSNSAASLVDFLFSGVLVRYPNLKLLYAEAQIGWIPYTLERADDVWITHQWAGGQAHCPEPPSTYYYRQVYSCFFKDPIGVKMLDEVGGAEHVCFETDYPHSDSTWPHSKEAAATQFGFLSQEEVTRIARGTAIELFGLPFSPDGR